MTDDAIMKGSKATWEEDQAMRKTLLRTFPALGRIMRECPARTSPLDPNSPCAGWDDLIERLIHLNDFHHWTRHQVADWLDSVPYKIEAVPQSQGD